MLLSYNKQAASESMASESMASESATSDRLHNNSLASESATSEWPTRAISDVYAQQNAQWPDIDVEPRRDDRFETKNVKFTDPIYGRCSMQITYSLNFFATYGDPSDYDYDYISMDNIGTRDMLSMTINFIDLDTVLSWYPDSLLQDFHKKLSSCVVTKYSAVDVLVKLSVQVNRMPLDAAIQRVTTLRKVRPDIAVRMAKDIISVKTMSIIDAFHHILDWLSTIPYAKSDLETMSNVLEIEFCDPSYGNCHLRTSGIYRFREFIPTEEMRITYTDDTKVEYIIDGEYDVIPIGTHFELSLYFTDWQAEVRWPKMPVQCIINEFENTHWSSAVVYKYHSILAKTPISMQYMRLPDVQRAMLSSDSTTLSAMPEEIVDLIARYIAD